ncbi:XTP/dITP diphosphatase [Salisediminibacterium beveridgei]|uniref:dITP/XTP pyrophosphatase n=1 Tax=Salisediminibacterium beveridgei TaxID=632773 RepID=A0A1D7QTI2_9BACI|nr:XTP/dITP diphosphatase [Salisediminibacterium beveridgei]AOM82324.1 Non-canonical purine NTP pyrophosphatase [Salisediminibacterium beveridgei]
MKEVMIATRNQGKVSEFEQFFHERGIQVKSLLDTTEIPDIVEDGLTFEANAIKKAVTVAEALGITVISDDSGLEVDALDGEPGIYSARYAGDEKNNDDANNQKLLKALEGKAEEQRTARFVCVLAAAFPSGVIKTVRGTAEGRIAETLSGTEGFGYDPLFILKGEERTMAHLTRAEKNQRSHRADALRQLEGLWDEWVLEHEEEAKS